MIRTLFDLLGPAATPPQRAARPYVEDAWTHVRQPESEFDKTLSEQAKTWLRHMPEFAWPKVLCCRYPRVANRLAQAWSDPAACEALLESLLFDARGGRTGFAPSIRAEIVRLDRFYQTGRPAVLQAQVDEDEPARHRTQ